MAKPKKKNAIIDYGPEEILSELQFREGSRKATAKRRGARPLAHVDSGHLVKALRDAQKLVYGVDDRIDMHQVTDPDILMRAEAVAALIDMVRLTDNGDGTSTLLTALYKNTHLLCEGERFRNQPVAPHCTGFLVAPDIIATAGHCIQQNNLAQTRFVFGFRMMSDSDARTVIANENIFRGIAILDREEVSTGADYALVRLDRAATGRPVLAIRRSGKIGDAQSVFVMGHPSGLPLKYAPGATVRDNADANFFIANLDTYGGNSGSPVFNTDDGTVEGILVRGDTDFVRVGNCYVSNVCPTTGCRGEDVTRTNVFADLVPDIVEPQDIESRVSRLESIVETLQADVDALKNQ
ncbi:MAG: serine protease [Desulfobacterales bacterium]|jgi:hypothetical protein